MIESISSHTSADGRLPRRKTHAEPTLAASDCRRADRDHRAIEAHALQPPQAATSAAPERPSPQPPPPGTVASLQPGKPLAGKFAVARKDRQISKNGSPYLSVELRDRTGTIPARVFRDVDQQGARFDRGDVIEVRGKVERFAGRLSAEITALRKVDPAQVDPAEFLPSAYRSVEELEGFLEHLTREVYDEGLRAVVESVLGSEPLAAEFRRAPCTRSSHHAYLGGLLEHTVSVGTFVSEVCQLHPRLDSDLLMAAALLHDVGRAREFTYGAEFGISEEGALLGHLNIGAQIIGPAAAGLPEERRLALLHCVLSHHGPEAAGRQRGPGSGYGLPEALALQRINAVDAGIKAALE